MQSRKKTFDLGLPQKFSFIFLFIKYFNILIFPVLIGLLISIGLIFNTLSFKDVILIGILLSLINFNFSSNNYLLFDIQNNIPSIDLNLIKKIFRKQLYIEFFKSFYSLIFSILLPLLLITNISYMYASNIILSLCLLNVISLILGVIFYYNKHYSIKRNYIYTYIAKIFLIPFFSIMIVYIISSKLGSIDLKFFNKIQIEFINFNESIIINLFLAAILTIIFTFFKNNTYDNMFLNKYKNFNSTGDYKFQKMSLFQKDLLYLFRSINTYIKFLPYYYYLYVFILIIIFLLNRMIFGFSDYYLSIIYLFLLIEISDYILEYTKKIISPDIEKSKLFNSYYQKLNLKTIITNKLYIHFWLHLPLITFTILVIFILNIEIISQFLITFLIIIICLLNSVISIISIYVYPKIKPESIFEYGNSYKSEYFQSFVKIALDIFLSLIFVNLFISKKISFDLSVIIVLICSTMLGVGMIIYFNNLKKENY